MIRPLAEAEAGWAAGRHAALMPRSVFALFGLPFLERFYRRLARSAHAVARVWDEAGRPQGVIVAVSDRRTFLRELLARDGARLALAAVRGLAARRECRRLLAQTPRYLARTRGTRTPAEMLFITVAPESRGHGVARDLILATLEEMRRRGVRRVNVTIESENVAVARVLANLGFRQVDQFVFADKPNALLCADLGLEGGDAAET